MLDIPDLQSDEHASNAGQGVDAGEYAQLYGIYSGQIQARIDRLWRRPRSPIKASKADTAREPDKFDCLVNIIQDSQGNVQEVLLPHCNGSAEWQRSLVLAIPQASPLPAPPKPTVFTRSIALSFSAIPYSPSAAADEYEIAAR